MTNNNLQYLRKYELRKTIRFLLKPVDHTPTDTNQDFIEMLRSFVTSYEEIVNNVRQLLFYKKDGQNTELSRYIKIKHGWMKVYTKSEFFAGKQQIIKIYKGRKQSNKITINEHSVSFLKEYFERWLEENKECITLLNTFLNAPEESQKRRSEAIFWLVKINKRSNFEFIAELFNGNIEHKSDNSDIAIIKTKLGDCKTLLLQLINIFSPSQSLGIELERASLNYYTVNKKPKDYPKEIRDKQKRLDETYTFQNNEMAFLQKVGFMQISLPIGELKEQMKRFKALQKSAFYEFASQNKNYQNLKRNQDLLLFNDISEENFKKFKNERSAQGKRKHFQYSFSNYKRFCELHKKIAVEFGKINAEIKALEKEKIDAEKLKSWAVLIGHRNQKYLMLIPRNSLGNLAKAKKYIDSLQNDSSGEWKIFAIESLTLRALDKLCFGFDKNTFMGTQSLVYKELQQKYQQFFDKDKLKRKDQFSENGKELIEFYQAVLSLDATKSALAIQKFDGLAEILQKNYENKEEFEKDLKQVCFYKKIVTISEKMKDDLIADFQGYFYKITSYDLEKDDIEVLENFKNKRLFDRNNPEIHTKIWLDFWSSDNASSKYPIRINPELKISFVEKRLDDLEERDLGKLGKNRRKEEQFLLSTSVTLNAHDEYVDLGFKLDDEIKKFFEDFSKQFNQGKKPFEQYYYGLDRGQKELLTLGLFKFSEIEKVRYKKHDGGQDEYHKPEFVNLEIYRIKENELTFQNVEGRYVYKSPDQFMDNSNVIEKINISSCLDLSCAKLIKGRIVLNGDISTYLALKITSAKRKIYEGVTHKKFTSEHVCFEDNKQAFFLNYENRGEIKNEYLYFYDDRFNSIISQDQIKQELQNYHDLVKQNKGYDFISIEKINHLRDAICANAVGILYHLYQRYPGLLVFEDLKKAEKEHHISQFSGNLASRIEWKILQKFQSLGLVPPSLKKVMNMNIGQLGCVVYVPTSGTSNKCPHCGVSNTDKKEKWESHAYVCSNENCGFDSKESSKRQGLNALSDSDKVATYNIAKRGLDKMINF